MVLELGGWDGASKCCFSIAKRDDLRQAYSWAGDIMSATSWEHDTRDLLGHL